MESNKYEEGLQQLQIIFYSLLAGQLLFAGVVYYLTTTSGQGPTYFLGENNDMLALGAYAVAMYFIARFMNRIRTKSIPAVQKTGGDAFGHYRATVIIRLALLEGATLFVITIALVTRNPQLLLLCLPLVLGFYAFRPTPEEFVHRYD